MSAAAMTAVKRWTRRLLGLAAIALALVSALLAWALASAQVELSQGGVHRRLLVPAGGGRMMAFPIYSGTGDAVSIPGYLEGPVVRRGADGGWTALWFCQDRVQHASGRGDALSIDCAGRRRRFDLSQVPAAEAVAPMPAALTVLSDLEGNAEFLDAALPALGIADAQGRWTYGAGQLLILGDSVDRGRDVSAVLWRLHDLAAQAQRAGGAVHVLLGNHEQYLLRTNNSRANPETVYALNRLGGYGEAFADGTVLGDWLRAQPVAVKLGSTLFVHGGVSRSVAEIENDPRELNRAMREYWPAARQGRHLSSPQWDAVLGLGGVTQYRGYLMAVEGHYGRVGEADLNYALERFGARRMVIAHTPVDRVEALFGGRLYAVDVNEPGARSQVLVFENDEPRVIELAVPRHADARAPVRLRDFEPSRAEDRRLLWAMIGQARKLSALPHPY